MKNIETVGIVAMPRISVGGGFARVTRDLIAALNSMGKKVRLATPFPVDMNKISELYGSVEIEKIYYPSKAKKFFSREDMLGRKLLKRTFRKMARDVDFIIDLDGGVLHNYLPKEFDKNNYVIWRLSCINPETHKLQKFTSWKVEIKKIMKRYTFGEKDVPHDVKIYPVDEWTKRELIQFWKVTPQEMCLYPEIKVHDFVSKQQRKKQIVVLGRIAQNKSIDESIRIFFDGTKKNPNYRLVILGGATPDSLPYIGKLETVSKELGIDEKVTIIKDPSFETIKNKLSESEVLIDSQKGVSLTMTAIEAMASGCIVLAQKNGGTYQEVLQQGKYGYGFTTVENGGEALAKIVEDLRRAKTHHANAVKRADFFSPENFKKRLEIILA